MFSRVPLPPGDLVEVEPGVDGIRDPSDARAGTRPVGVADLKRDGARLRQDGAAEKKWTVAHWLGERNRDRAGRSPVDAATEPLLERRAETTSRRRYVEREFGRLKNEYGLTPLRVRARERVALHAELTMPARLSQALARSRALRVAA